MSISTSFSGDTLDRTSSAIHIGTTYVAVENETILGFATVAVGHVEIETFLRLYGRSPRLSAAV